MLKLPVSCVLTHQNFWIVHVYSARVEANVSDFPNTTRHKQAKHTPLLKMVTKKARSMH